MKEKEWQAKVVETCNWLGLRHYHTYDSRRSNAGYPDLTIVGSAGILFAELKTEKGVVSPQQTAWVNEINAAGGTAMVVRPSEFQRLLAELKRIAGK